MYIKLSNYYNIYTKKGLYMGLKAPPPPGGVFQNHPPLTKWFKFLKKQKNHLKGIDTNDNK